MERWKKVRLGFVEVPHEGQNKCSSTGPFCGAGALMHKSYPFLVTSTQPVRIGHAWQHMAAPVTVSCASQCAQLMMMRTMRRAWR